MRAGVGEEEADEIGERLGVLLDAVEIVLVLAVADAAVAGADRIDEDEVGEVEPARIVVGEAGRGTEQLVPCRSRR